MLRLFTVVFAIAAAALGFYSWNLRGELSTLRERVTALEGERDAAQKARLLTEKETEPLRENIARLTKERDQAKGERKPQADGALEASKVAEVKAEAKPGAGLDSMAKVFQTEEGKKMMKAQMAMAMKMQYSDLARVLQLSPQAADQVMALLSERAAQMAGDPFKFMTADGFDEEGLKKMAEETQASRKSYDEKLRALLGEEKFKELQTYEKSAGERMLMAQLLEPQLTSSGAPLQAGQRDQLLQIMTEQRQKSPPSVFDQTGRDAAANIRAMADDTAVDRWFAQEQDFHQRVLQEAPKVLSPDQVNALQTALTQSAEMQKFGIKMGREMFKAKKSGAAAAPAPAPANP